MPINKQAYIRYQTLDKCFRNPGKRYFIHDLCDACEESLEEFMGPGSSVSRRQIFEDIKFMESSQGWSIELNRLKEGRKVYYRYTDTNFSINNNLTNEAEIIQLKEAVNTLLQFKGMPQFDWVEEIAQRLSKSIKFLENTQKIVEFDQNPYLKGIEYFNDIYNAICYRTTLAIKYKGILATNAETYLVSPYYLKQHNKRWFFLGKSKSHFDISIFALDRIQSIKQSKEPYENNEVYNFNEFFDDVIGVTISKGSTPENIIIKIKSEVYHYISTKPLHGSQKLKESNIEFKIIELSVIPNYELLSTLLSYGADVTVLEPKHLAESIKRIASEIVSNYN